MRQSIFHSVSPYEAFSSLLNEFGTCCCCSYTGAPNDVAYVGLRRSASGDVTTVTVAVVMNDVSSDVRRRAVVQAPCLPVSVRSRSVSSLCTTTVHADQPADACIDLRRHSVRPV